MRLVVVASVFLAAVGVLVGVGIQSNSISTVEYASLLSDPSRYEGETIIVPNGRIRSIANKFPIDFQVSADGFEDQPIHVVGDASPPQNFKESLQVVLRGTYDPGARRFEASMVTTQCPSRYSSEEAYERARAAIAEAREESSSPSPTPESVR